MRSAGRRLICFETGSLVLQVHRNAWVISVLLVMSATWGAGCRTATAAHIEGPQVVSEVLAALVREGRFPVSESSVGTFIPARARRRLAVVEQVGGHDRTWTDAAGVCFVNFLVESRTRTVGHLWAKCTTTSNIAARSVLDGWLEQLAPVLTGDQKMPDLGSGYATINADFDGPVGVDVSIDNVDGSWVAGIGLRNGVKVEIAK